MTWPGTRTRSGPRSASPASSPRWTTCSPARRTSSSWPTCATWAGARAGGARPSCSTSSTLLTTQYLEEADELADRIALLDNGRLVAEGTAGELKHRIPGGHIRLQFACPEGLESAAQTLGGEAVRDDEALTLQVPSDGSVKSIRALLDRLDDASVEVGGLSIHTPDLDDVFLTLTGQPDKDKEPAR